MLEPSSTLQDDYDTASLDMAVLRTIEQLKKQPQEENWPHVGESSLETLLKFHSAISQKQARGGGEGVSLGDFAFQQVSKRSTLFTGYFQPTLKGSLKKTPEAPFPVYAHSENSFTRAEIDCDGALADKGLEIAWVSDAIDLFFLHIQGSGIIELADGATRHVVFAGHNNHSYYAIGKHLVEIGAFKSHEASAQKIQSYLRSNPNDVQNILNLNSRYIFFKLLDQGPVGTLGTTLVPMRSIAADWDFYPPGALCYVELSIPTFDANGAQVGQRATSFFTINQDTGSAIKGTARADIYCGSGSEAALLAGHLNHRGTIYKLEYRG